MNNENELGDAPIEEGLIEVMNQLASGIDQILNRNNEPKPNGFILMCFPFEGSRCNYISNANRKDVLKLLKEQVRHFERDDRKRRRKKK